MKFVANRDKLNISKDAYIEGDVGIGPIPTGFGIEVTLNIHLEGMDQEEAKTGGCCAYCLSILKCDP